MMVPALAQICHLHSVAPHVALTSPPLNATPNSVCFCQHRLLDERLAAYDVTWAVVRAMWLELPSWCPANVTFMLCAPRLVLHSITSLNVLVVSIASADCREGLPVFLPQAAKLEDLVAQGQRLAREQEQVEALKLSREYLKHSQSGAAATLIGLQG